MRVIGVFDIFNSDNADEARALQEAAYNRAYGKASDLLSTGRGALETNYAAGLQPFQQNFATATGGQNAYADATGANGATGYARALQNFQTNPGYQFQLQQGNENILRNAARTTGTAGLGSGNTNLDLLKYGQGLANQSWGQYTQNLQPFLGQSTANAQGIGNLYSQLGTQLNQSYGTQANAAYGTEVGIGNAQANAALASNAASGNFMNMLMGIAGLGSNTVGAGAISGAMNGIGSLGALMFSDERVKEDIERVGELYDGTNIYRYRYKGDPDQRMQIGVMAQEVEQSRPDAVVEIGGIKAVDYSRATDLAAGLAHFLEAA